MSVSIWQQPLGQASQFECEVAVIGAGIIGAYSAHTLAERGRSVALLETRFPAAGATGRNAGFCTMGGAENYVSGVQRYGREQARELWLMTLENQRKTRAFIEKFGTYMYSCGGVKLGTDAAESARLAESYEMMHEDNIPCDFSPTDPYGRGFGAALFQPTDFGLDPVGLVNALIQNANLEKLRLFAPAEVFAISPANGGKLLIEARGVNVLCEQIALCTNAYSAMIAPYFRDKIFPKRGQILVTAPLKRRVLDKLAGANHGYEYFRQLEDGSFLLGGGRDEHLEAEIGYDEVATAGVQNSLEAFMRKYYPDVLAEVPIVRRWAGTMGFAADYVPIVGQLPYFPGTFQLVSQPFVPEPTPQADTTPVSPTPPNIYFAAGFTGHGMGWGMITADFMLGQMLGQRKDGGFFDVKRLGK